MKKWVRYIIRVVVLLLLTIIIILGTVYMMLKKCTSTDYPAARELFVTTIMESGQLKFVAHMLCSDEEISEIVSKNAMEKLEADVDKSLIVIGDATDSVPELSDENEEFEFDENGIAVMEIPGRSFLARMMVVKDPSKVFIASIYPWKEYGNDLDVILKDAGAVAGVNGGLYVSAGHKGGRPLGVVVQEGEITYNDPANLKGLYLIGFNEDDILVISDIEGKTKEELEEYIKTERIRDAIAFLDEASDANNHFVPLIINGQARSMGGMGSGANPRTAIGQRADGAVLLLVTDGRGTGGHLGATASDLISIMQDFGAVNAANIDGGSSSTMYYNDEYLMTSVTFYFSNSSWNMPTAFGVRSMEAER